MAMLYMFRADAHTVTHPIERVLELRRLEKRQLAILCPFSSYIRLRLQRSGPVYGAPPAPVGAGDEGEGGVVAGVESAVLEEVCVPGSFVHGEAVGRVVVGLIDDEDRESRLGEVLR